MSPDHAMDARIRPAALRLVLAVSAALCMAAALALLFSPLQAQEGAAPAKPTGLSAEVSHDSVTLTWDDPQDGSITGYVILRRNRETDAQGQFTELVADTGSAATTYTDDSVAAETPYTYRIKAINAHGSSERSRWFHIDTPAAPAPTPEPTPEPEPESAQGQSTPGAGARANVSEPAGEDLPADTTTTGRVEVGGSVTGTSTPPSDRDWFAVELEADKRYQIDLEGEATGRGTMEDPYLRGVYDASGTKIANTDDDDGGEGVNSRLIFTPTATGTYYLQASEFDSQPGTYTLSVREVGFTEGRTDLAGNATTRGEVEVGGLAARGVIAAPVLGRGNFYTFDKDWFQVELQAGRTYRIDLAPVIHVRDDGTYAVPLLPEIVALYDADSDYLHHTSDRESSGPGYAARVEFTPRSSGAYYISAAGLGFTAGEYELRVRDITQ